MSGKKTDFFSDKIAIVTGAASGIGRAMSYEMGRSLSPQIKILRAQKRPPRILNQTAAGHMPDILT